MERGEVYPLIRAGRGEHIQPLSWASLAFDSQDQRPTRFFPTPDEDCKAGPGIEFRVFLRNSLPVPGLPLADHTPYNLRRTALALFSHRFECGGSRSTQIIGALSQSHNRVQLRKGVGEVAASARTFCVLR
jgi:hypothetical protein